ncbi:MAG: ferrous iron transport protein A [Lachnospiraceae bacterium]|nr:ferrous iron transport protein A [Lachnospiraceae bacterium]MDE7434535.1 ferrous iron transport protein A [Lachnospiraceae bacterium]
MTLDKLPIGREAVITKVGGEGILRCRFLDMGLIPKTRVTVRKVAPMGDPIELEIRGYELTIRKEDAGQIEVVYPGEEEDAGMTAGVIHR